MTRRGWAFVVFVILVEIVTISLYQKHSPPPPGREVPYIVKQGDTLWGIASRLYPGQHTGKMVDAIRRASGLEGARGPVIRPGQVIWVPEVRQARLALEE